MLSVIPNTRPPWTGAALPCRSSVSEPSTCQLKLPSGTTSSVWRVVDARNQHHVGARVDDDHQVAPGVADRMSRVHASSTARAQVGDGVEVQVGERPDGTDHGAQHRQVLQPRGNSEFDSGGVPLLSASAARRPVIWPPPLGLPAGPGQPRR